MQPLANVNALPLDGVRVLELGNFIAAPFAARIFADFGAEVIKIEKPGSGDEVRDWRTPRGKTSMIFRTLGRNKKSVELDLRDERGREAILELAKSTDVVIENFRPGTLERWGIGPDQLTAVNPDIVLVRISGYGQTGPYRDRAGFGSAAESFAGLRYITGEPDRPAGRAAAPIGDSVAGLYGVIGALMLMMKRQRLKSAGLEASGDKADNVADVALYESVFSILESLVPDYDAYGVIRQRQGAVLPGVVPAGAYPTADDLEVVIGGNSNSVFQRLMVAIGRADLANDESLTSTSARSAREQELNAAIREWTSAHDLDAALEILSEAGVPAAPVFDAKSLAEDEHYIARDMVQPMEVVVEDQPELVRFPGIVPKIASHDGKIRWVGPDLGADTDQVLRDVAGYSDEQIDALSQEVVNQS
ncbi:CaiB/BaiF CoA transferase family protein [Enteractinococcus helveticum]|uniref:Formyl-CoA transferase n=1 Tax=Enteractinococcus helveticum TaxID=1837282 RepID=A0A1B7M0E2_9MICC|nr:CaiB/BaiF CoA-transferase family protein [Enteractinococcus helveticum]OAV61537.1 formyl-CoA transferase [Enteractinococcus helveticum]